MSSSPTDATAAVAPVVVAPHQHPPPEPWPLFDWFLDLPHPAASKSCPGPFLIPSPVTPNPVADEIQTILPQIARFAFPEYDETVAATASSPTNATTASTPPLLNRYDVYAMQNESFLHFTFSLQLQTGARVHGHVRRYLPPHLTARTRFDVGRRGERALVLLSRATGADLLYASILKSVEAISSQQAVLSSTGKAPHNGNPQQWFLHQLSRYQIHLSRVYERQPPTERGKPLVASIPGLEFGDDHDVVRKRFQESDVSRFIIPVSLLVRSSSSLVSGGAAITAGKQQPPLQAAAGSIVPLLRCVGVAHALRIIAALASERRVILVSNSPTRLAVCSTAAVSILAVGLLHWQHLYIPVLPPHLWPYLAAPYPYLIGILTSTVARLDRTDGLGEVLIIHLDSNQMETRGMEASTILQRLPDLFRIAVDQVQQQIPGSLSASETLAQELFEVLRQDKKVLYGDSTFNKVGETAAIATKVVKNTFFKLRDKGRQFIQQRNQSGMDEGQSPTHAQETSVDDDAPAEVNSMSSDYIYTEGCHNEVAEQEARIAFTAFFLSMFGDMRWYLSTSTTGPVLDREKFLKQKRSMGDGEGTPMSALLNNFCQSQMLEEFAKARIEEVRARTVISFDMPLFLQCAAHCRQHNLDFGVSTMQKITRQVADASPARLTGLLQTNARRTAMTLTSNKGYEGDNSQAIAQLVEQCRESSSILFDVMSVIWLRLRDCRGMQWKHGYQALQILRNLLYHGPMAAITEATDGMSKIRAMKSYGNIRSQSMDQVRAAAATIYDLLVDRAKLFQIRKVCAERRRLLQSKTEPKRIREANTRIGVPFRNIHATLHPSASSGTVVPIPPKAPTSQTMARGNSQSAPLTPSAQSTDLLDVGGAASDVIDLLGSVTVSQIATSHSPMGSASANPFDAFKSPMAAQDRPVDHASLTSVATDAATLPKSLVATQTQGPPHPVASQSFSPVYPSAAPSQGTSVPQHQQQSQGQRIQQSVLGQQSQPAFQQHLQQPSQPAFQQQHAFQNNQQQLQFQQQANVYPVGPGQTQGTSPMGHSSQLRQGNPQHSVVMQGTIGSQGAAVPPQHGQLPMTFSGQPPNGQQLQQRGVAVPTSSAAPGGHGTHQSIPGPSNSLTPPSYPGQFQSLPFQQQVPHPDPFNPLHPPPPATQFDPFARR